MDYDYSKVHAAMRYCETANGRPFIRAPLDFGTRVALLELLKAYGVDTDALEAVQDNDLCVMYATTRKDMARGEAVAKRIRDKYTPNPLIDLTTPPTPPKYDDRSPPKDGDDRRELMRQLGPDLAAFLADVQRKTAEQVREALDETKQLQSNVVETFLKFNEALPEVVAGHVATALRDALPTRVIIEAPDMPKVDLGVSHCKTADIIKALAAGVNVYLHGPAGSGKTTVARKAAEAFGLQFYFAAKVESEYLLLGFKDARGETVRTQFREAYEHGGMFLFDELDGSSPQAVVALNAALANGICPFPDGIIQRHPDFKCIAAGNTKLSGASRQYTGRTQLDAASIDRFVFIEFDYDEALERALATDHQWALYVQACRKAVRARGLPHLVTPRATLDGCKLIASGFDADTVADMVIWKGLDTDTVQALQREIGDISDYGQPSANAA